MRRHNSRIHNHLVAVEREMMDVGVVVRRWVLKKNINWNTQWGGFGVG